MPVLLNRSGLSILLNSKGIFIWRWKRHMCVRCTSYPPTQEETKAENDQVIIKAKEEEKLYACRIHFLWISEPQRYQTYYIYFVTYSTHDRSCILFKKWCCQREFQRDFQQNMYQHVWSEEHVPLYPSVCSWQSLEEMYLLLMWEAYLSELSNWSWYECDFMKSWFSKHDDISNALFVWHC